VLDNGSGQRTQNPERRASRIGLEIVKPFRSKVTEWNDALVRINMLKERTERRLVSGRAWQREVVDLAAQVGAGQISFLTVIGELPPNVRESAPVENVDLAIKRLLVNLGGLGPVRRQSARSWNRR